MVCDNCAWYRATAYKKSKRENVVYCGRAKKMIKIDFLACAMYEEIYKEEINWKTK